MNSFRLCIIYLLIYSSYSFSDNFNYNSFNNHGMIGLVNMPTARIYDESSHGITAYLGTPDQKITLTSSPFDWLEASFFYTNIDDRKYCVQDFDPVCDQDYKDKGFNFKVRLKKEGLLPAIAIGVNDLAGTGLYSSEYIVASYGIHNFDFHFGLGWGSMNGSKYSFKNPFTYLHDSFDNRPSFSQEDTGNFNTSVFFSDKKVSPFFGLSYIINKNLVFKIENDTTVANGEEVNFFSSPEIGYEKPKYRASFGIDYSINNNFIIGLSQERGNYLSLRFVYKNNPLKSNKVYKYKSAEMLAEDNRYTKLIKNLENNGIGVNKIIETSESIGLELTQFIHPNIDIVEDIIFTASKEAGIDKDIKKDMRVANLQVIAEYDKNFEENARLVYKRKDGKKFNTNTKLTFRPFLASREEFFKGAILLENNSEYIFQDNFFFSSNLKYTLADNFDDLIYPPKDTFPAQVRSDVKDYLRNFDQGIIIGRAQFDFYSSLKQNHHLMLTAGILEEMFSGYGLEYLYFKDKDNYALGFEVFDVKKRDYKMQFGTLDYRNVTSAVNFYYRNYGSIPFDAKISYGEYLAGDKGFTFEASRSFKNGVEYGVFASFTDVTSEQFGEGSFDKGIFFNIPIFGNFINYTWKPLTKDPGAKLIRKNTLHDLLIKFKPHNS